MPLFVGFEGTSGDLVELLGAEISQPRVTPDAIGKTFEETKHAGPRLRPGRVVILVNTEKTEMPGTNRTTRRAGDVSPLIDRSNNLQCFKITPRTPPPLLKSAVKPPRAGPDRRIRRNPLQPTTFDERTSFVSPQTWPAPCPYPRARTPKKAKNRTLRCPSTTNP